MLGWDAATFFTEKKKRRSARRLCSVVELFCLVELVLFCLIVLGNVRAAVPLIPRWWAEIKRQEDVGLKFRRRGAAACCFSFPHRWILRGGGCMGWSCGTGAMSASSDWPVERTAVRRRHDKSFSAAKFDPIVFVKLPP